MREEVRRIPIERIVENPHQPRRRWTEESLEELAASIRQHGFLQPILVRPIGPRFELIAGERRLRAARLLRLEEIPAIVRPMEDGQAAEAALIENLQREELTIVETAQAYQRLVDQFRYTQSDIAERLGKSRAAVANTLRLLQLPKRVLELVHRGELTEGHARALLALGTPALQWEAARWAAENAATVREMEQQIRRLLSGEERRPAARGGAAKERPHLESLEQRLRERFGTKAVIRYARGRGSVSLEFYSDEDLNRLLELLGVL